MVPKNYCSGSTFINSEFLSILMKEKLLRKNLNSKSLLNDFVHMFDFSVEWREFRQDKRRQEERNQVEEEG